MVGAVQPWRTWSARTLGGTTETSWVDSLWGGVNNGSLPARSTPGLPTPHYSSVPDLGQIGPGRGPPQRQPRSQAAAQPPGFLQSSHPGPLHQPTSHHSLELGLGRTQQRKGHGLGLLLSRGADTCVGGAWVHCDHVGFTCFSSHMLWDRACIQGPWSLTEPDPLGFCSNNWGAHPTPCVTATEQRGDPTRHPAQALDTPPITSAIRRMTASTLWGKTWLACIPKTALASKIQDSHSLHRDTPTLKQPFKTTVD